MSKSAEASLLGKIPKRYDIRGKLGDGAFSIVYEAFDRQERRIVALKILKELGPAGRFRDRLAREFQVCQQLNHPNVIRIYDFSFTDEFAYLAMEKVKAKDLATVLQDGPLDFVKAVHIVAQVASALSHIHKKGLVHRDVKPENIMVQGDGRAILMDFNLVSVPDRTAITQSDEIVGTPAYFAPEVILQGVSSPPVDIYALGLCFYEALTGEAAFEMGGLDKLVQAIMHDDPIRPTTINPKLPKGVDRVVRRATAKNPSERYRSAAALRAAVISLLSKEARSTMTVEMVLPARKKRAISSGRRLTVAVFVALALVMSMIWWRGPKETQLYGLVQAPAVEGVALSFLSPRANSFQISINKMDGTLAWRSPPEPSSAKEHLFIIPRKWWQANHYGAIQSASSSQITTFALRSLSTFKLLGPFFEHTRRGTWIKWRTNISVNGEIVFKRPIRQSMPKRYGTAGKEHKVFIPARERILKEHRFMLKVKDQFGGWRRTKTKKLPAVDLAAFHEAIKSFTADGGLARYHRLGPRQLLTDLENRRELLALAKEVVPFSRFLFASRALSTLDRIALYSSLRVLRRIDIFLFAQAKPPIFGWDLIDEEFVSQACIPAPPFGPKDWPVEVFSRKLKSKERRFYPLLKELTSDSPISIVKEEVGAAEIRNFKFTFGPTWVDDLCFGGRATLYLHTKLRFPKTILVITINTTLAIDLWEAERKASDKERHYLIEIPASFLDANEIDLQLALKLASPKRSLSGGAVYEIAFLPGPRAHWLERFDAKARQLVKRPLLIERK